MSKIQRATQAITRMIEGEEEEEKQSRYKIKATSQSEISNHEKKINTHKNYFPNVCAVCRE